MDRNGNQLVKPSIVSQELKVPSEAIDMGALAVSKTYAKGYVKFVAYFTAKPVGSNDTVSFETKTAIWNNGTWTYK
jgi:hypothetical protein